VKWKGIFTMTPLPLRQAALAAERKSHVKSFAALCRLYMEAKGDILTARAIAANNPHASSFVQNVFAKAGPGAIGGSSPTAWAGQLVDFRLLAGAFLAELRHTGVFDGALSDMMRVPLRSAVAVSALAIVGDAVNEAESKLVSELQLSAAETDVRKATALVVVSAELLRLIAVVENMIASSLRAAVVSATDKTFVDALIAATTPSASSGDVLSDLQTLLAAIDGHAASKYYFVVDPSAAKVLSVLPGASGVQFPGMSPSGGQLGNIVTLVSDQLDGTAVMFDASQIAGASEGLSIDVARFATLDMGEGGSPPLS
jgi:hypothetical protein